MRPPESRGVDRRGTGYPVTTLAAMATRGRISLLALLAAAVLAGCGSDDESIPQESGEKLEARLDEVAGANERGDCDGAEASARLLVEQVGEGEGSEVPEDVDPEVRRVLQQGCGPQRAVD